MQQSTTKIELLSTALPLQVPCGDVQGIAKLAVPCLACCSGIKAYFWLDLQGDTRNAILEKVI